MIIIPSNHDLIEISKKSDEALFDGDDALFKHCASAARVYGEYGVGQSTNWIYRNTSIDIYGVDSSKDWVERVLSDKQNDSRVNLRWVDVGVVGEWGRPINYAKREDFCIYVKSIWDRAKRPDFVLIDGRFRVCCFFCALLEASPGTKLIFDDYLSRPHYHVVEEVLKPVGFCGRQALFSVSEVFDREKAALLMDKFEYVMD